MVKPRNHVGNRPFWTIRGTWVSKNHFLVSSLSLSLVPSTWESTSGSRSSIVSWSFKQKTTEPLKMASQYLATEAQKIVFILCWSVLFCFSTISQRVNQPKALVVVHFTSRQISNITYFWYISQFNIKHLKLQKWLCKLHGAFLCA